MKFTIALLSIGAFCLSTVEAIHNSYYYYHKGQWNPPCEEGDTECWANVGSQCDNDDDECLALAIGAKQEDLPDCEDGDDQCWLAYWVDFWNTVSGDSQNHRQFVHVRKIINQHKKAIKENHHGGHW